MRARQFTSVLTTFFDYLTNIHFPSQNEINEKETETVMYSTLAASELDLNGAFFDLMVLYDQRNALVGLAEIISLKEVRRGKREQEKIAGKKERKQGREEKAEDQKHRCRVLVD